MGLPSRRLASIVLTSVVLVGCPGQRPIGSGADAGSVEADRLVGVADGMDREIVGAGLVFDDPGLDRLLARVAARVRPGGERPIRVRAVRSWSLNAFALPNGSIWVHVGLLAHLADEPQLALVLAHEIVHLDHGHAVAAMRDRAQMKILGQIAGLIVAPIGLADPTATGLYAVAVAGYGREREAEADRAGFERVARAGYPTASLPALFDAMDAVDEGPSHTLYSDHPSNAARKAALVALVGTAQAPDEASRDAFRNALRPAAAESIRLCVEGGDPRRALAEADAQLATDPADARLHLYRGDALRKLASGSDDRQQRMAEAAAAYERALRLDPALAEGHRGLGYVAVLRDDKPTARRELEAYLRSAPRATDRRFVQSILTEGLAE